MPLISRLSSLIKLAGCAAGGVALVACASLAPQTPEQIVAARSQSYWDARIQGQIAKAYALTNDAYRLAAPEQKFASDYRSTFATAAEVRKVECQVDRCDVGVNLKVNPPLMGKKMGTIDMYATETWLLEGGQWHLFVEP